MKIKLNKKKIIIQTYKNFEFQKHQLVLKARSIFHKRQIKKIDKKYY